MNKAQERKKLKGLSKRAQALYARLKQGRFYKGWGMQKIPKAMSELTGAGLVQLGGRVAVITSCYVPVRGFKPLRCEEWPED